METSPSPQATTNPMPEQTSAPTADVSGVPEYPKDLYDAAHIENGHRDFNDRIMAVRAPNQGKPEYIPPPVPAAVAKQTELEMKAGAERVKHFAEQKAVNQALAKRTPEKWEGGSTPVFRPPDASEYKNTFKSPAHTPSKDSGLRQPVPR